MTIQILRDAMLLTSRTVATFLLFALAAASPVVHVLEFSSSPHHPRGCHRHAPAIPSPATENFQCCRDGHQEATPRAAFAERALMVLGAVCDIGAERFTASFCDRANPAKVADSPPFAAPLRV